MNVSGLPWRQWIPRVVAVILFFVSHPVVLLVEGSLHSQGDVSFCLLILEAKREFENSVKQKVVLCYLLRRKTYEIPDNNKYKNIVSQLNYIISLWLDKSTREFGE